MCLFCTLQACRESGFRLCRNHYYEAKKHHSTNRELAPLVAKYRMHMNRMKKWQKLIDETFKQVNHRRSILEMFPNPESLMVKDIHYNELFKEMDEMVARVRRAQNDAEAFRQRLFNDFTNF